MKGKKGLIIVIFLGILLAAFPLYGKALGEVLWGTSGESTITGTVTSKGVDYIKVEGTTIYVKGTWYYNGTSLSSEELLGRISIGETLTVHYFENPRWGYVADEIVFEDGSRAVREE